MGQALVKLEPIRLPDPAQPAVIPSWPAWVESLSASAKKAIQPDPTGKYREIMTLPANRIPTEPMKAAMAKAIGGLTKLTEKTPLNDHASEKSTLVIVTKMMQAIPAQRATEAGVEAAGEAYLAALDDVPSWTVAEAIRKWHRGEHGPTHDYRWRPAPAILRKLALAEVFRVRGRILVLEQLVSAEPLIEFSEEHCREMREKVAALFKPAADKARALAGMEGA